MKDTPDQVERLESLKAGIVAGASLLFAFIFTKVVNNLFFAKYVVALNTVQVEPSNWRWLVSGTVAVICGFLFGVTYRYIIRGDRNFHLKSGAVLAFGGVRGLTQLDIGLSTSGSVLPFAIVAGESILWFTIAAIILNWVIGRGWVKTFK